MKKVNKKIDLSTNLIMGILNLSPTSFYDGKRYNTIKEVLCQVEKMISEGAHIIDVGAQSSNPGSKEILVGSEIERLIPAISAIKEKFPDTMVSIDTYRSETAKICVENGADIINDISGGELDKKMFDTISELRVPYILMHMQGTPKNMQKNPKYKNIIEEIISYFKERISILESLGVNDIILDPGIGFGKTTEHNYEIIKNLYRFKEIGYPILIGVSRKSMIYKPLNITPDESLNGTTIINTIAIEQDVNILRVHDVKEAAQCIKIVNFVKNI